LAGDSGAGKSSFLLRFCSNEFSGDVPSTLGVDFRVKQLLVDGEQTTVQIWDTAGQERFRSIARSYFRKAHGVLLLYDISS
ncbi:RASEF protein, partial [Nothocercus julius]|nr:RASEF protein [Nothocercus julius]